jgi:hypothetical protein
VAGWCSSGREGRKLECPVDHLSLPRADRKGADGQDWPPEPGGPDVGDRSRAGAGSHVGPDPWRNGLWHVRHRNGRERDPSRHRRRRLRPVCGARTVAPAGRRRSPDCTGIHPFRQSRGPGRLSSGRCRIGACRRRLCRVGSDWRNTFMLAAAATPLATLLLLRDGQLRGLGAVVIAQVPIAMVRPGSMIALLGAFWMAGLPMTALQGMVAWLLACFTAMVLASAVLHSRIPSLGVSGPAPSLPLKWLVNASPFLGATVVVIIFSQVLTLMLAALVGAEAAGLYQPITYLAPVLALPVLALGKPLAPRIVELWRHGEQSTLRRITWMYTIATFAGTSAIGLAVLFFGSFGLSFFGPEFVAVEPALRWIVAATIIYAALGPSEILSSMMNAQHIVLGGSLFALAVTVALAALLIPTWGVDGATIAFAAGIVSGRSAMLMVTVRRFGFDSSLVGALRFAFRRVQ